ncbi:MAG: SRPBCC family protein [Bacteroidia bacterium]|jgi:ligand-binding SRPBCC domain-containing protein
MLHHYTTTQFIKSDIDTVWDFMRSPKNLAKITPAHMGFNIVGYTEGIETMYAGQIIEYYVKPIAGIPLHWATEITQVKHKEYFIDEQRFGPYTFWHHKHFLKVVEGGVEMTDIIHYKAPFGIIGRIANALFIKQQVKAIFDYRFKKIDELFNNGK